MGEKKISVSGLTIFVLIFVPGHFRIQEKLWNYPLIFTKGFRNFLRSKQGGMYQIYFEKKMRS